MYPSAMALDAMQAINDVMGTSRILLLIDLKIDSNAAIMVKSKPLVESRAIAMSFATSS
jgi:hypothetical protein